MMHCFNIRIAERYGVNCAVILENIRYWVEVNSCNDKNFHDDCYWTYNSVKAFSTLFPYLSQKQILTALQKLEDNDIIRTGNYNEKPYDRTKWYTITAWGYNALIADSEVHLFDKDIAFKYGVNSAIILENLRRCIEKNEANDNNFFDGTYWTYNTVKSFSLLFPYMSNKQITNALHNLEDNGLIIRGNYNKVTYDQTTWYAITEDGFSVIDNDFNAVQKGKCNVPKCQMEVPEMSNGSSQNVKSNVPKCQMEVPKMSNGSSQNVKSNIPKCQTNTNYKPYTNTVINHNTNTVSLNAHARSEESEAEEKSEEPNSLVYQRVTASAPTPEAERHIQELYEKVYGKKDIGT